MLSHALHCLLCLLASDGDDVTGIPPNSPVHYLRSSSIRLKGASNQITFPSDINPQLIMVIVF